MSQSLHSNLLHLDFSPHDAQVYLALLKKGPCAAGPLISETKLHRNVAYTSLDHLIGRKLVSETQRNGRKLFAIAEPSVLEEEFSQKSLLAKDIQKEIRALQSRKIPDITVHQGNIEYLSLLSSNINRMPKESTKYVLGTGGEEFMRSTMLPIWKKYHEIAHARKIKIKMLSYEPQRSAIEPHIKKESIYEIRYLPANIENPAGIHIYPNIHTVLNIMYSNHTTPVTAIKIIDEALTQGYLNLFHNLWKIAQS